LLRYSPSYSECYHRILARAAHMNKSLRLLLTIIVAGMWAVRAHATETQEVQKKLASGEYDAIVQSRTDALQSTRLSNGNRAVALSERSGAYFALGRYRQSLEDANAAIDLKPDLAEAYFNRANASCLISDLTRATAESAVVDLTTAIRLKPDYEKAYRVRGNFYQFLGQIDKERADYDSAIRVAPNSAAVYVERGVFFSSHDEYAKAIADYDAAIRFDPSDAFVYLLRGHSYESLGRREQAIADYRKALSLGPDDGLSSEALKNLGAAAH
jgi:tetratricopeptide (TPR) repeat protein